MSPLRIWIIYMWRRSFLSGSNHLWCSAERLDLQRDRTTQLGEQLERRPNVNLSSQQKNQQVELDQKLLDYLTSDLLKGPPTCRRYVMQQDNDPNTLPSKVKGQDPCDQQTDGGCSKTRKEPAESQTNSTLVGGLQDLCVRRRDVKK